MEFLYLSDKPEHADLPRSKYIKMNSKKASSGAPSKYKLQQQKQLSQIRKPVNKYSDDDLDYEDDERICEIDRKIEMRKKMLAEEKAQNDPSQYFSNRAKMLRETSSSSIGSADKNQNINSRKSTKANRLDAMAKISETFGYGEKIEGRKNEPSLRKPSAPTEPRSKKKVQAATKLSAQSEDQKQPPKRSPRGVKKWDFSKPTNITKQPNIDVDPELDGMLAKLEMDEDFMKLSDNEQIAWLESLFFLDTPSKQASSGLVKPRPREIPDNSRRPTSSTMSSAKVDTSPLSVSSKSLSIQSNSGRTPAAALTANPKLSESPVDNSEDVPPGKVLDKLTL